MTAVRPIRTTKRNNQQHKRNSYMSKQDHASNLRELIPPGGQRKERNADQMAKAGPLGLDYPATQVGVVGNIKVLYDPALGAQGLALANQMLHAVSGPYNDMQTDFGVAGGATSVGGSEEHT